MFNTGAAITIRVAFQEFDHYAERSATSEQRVTTTFSRDEFTQIALAIATHESYLDPNLPPSRNPKGTSDYGLFRINNTADVLRHFSGLDIQ